MIFVIGHLGDYHVPRYEALLSLAETRGNDVFLVEIFGRSGFYAFPQPRRAAFFERHPARSITLEEDLTDAGGRWISIACKLLRVVQRLRPDVVITLGYDTPYSLWLWLLRRTVGFRIIYMSDSKADDGPRRWLKERLKKSIVSRFDGAFVAGERHRTYAQSLGIPLERSRIGFDVIDVERFSQAANSARRTAEESRATHGLPEKYVLCVSRFVRRKNVDVLIDAYAQSEIAKDGISLVLVGQGPDESAIRQLIATKRLDEQVHFLDPMPNSTMPVVYALSEFTVLASQFDQWGLCVNEAFAASRTAIVTDTCGAAGELLIDGVNGFVVKPGDADSLAQTILLLARNHDLRGNFARRARLSVDKWGPSTFANNLLELAEQLHSP